MKSKTFVLLAVFGAASFSNGPALQAKVEAKASAKKPVLKTDSSPITEGVGNRLATYADVIEPVQNAVVSVYSTKIIRERVPVNPFFRQFYGDRAPERESKEQGLGSGVIVSADGFILTNNHVVEGADELNVALADDREFKAKVIGSDPKTDVAVIKIEAENLPFVTLADSDKLRVGDIVFAVGNPLGIGQTVTMGLVSAKGRNKLGLLDGGNGYENFIQTDAAINMGNSGGALIDAKGRLIGINTAIMSTTRGNIGIGFAIPINLAAGIMHSLIETGSVTRGFLGVQVDPVTAEMAEAFGLKKDVKAVVVMNLTADGPAEKAGLRRGDIILSMDGHSMSSIQELRLIVSQTAPDTEVEIKYVRDSKEKVVKIKLARLPDDDASQNEMLSGVEVVRLTEELRRRLNFEDEVDGLVVTDVAPDSPYADRIVPNMVIVEINRSPVKDLEHAHQLIKPGRNLLLVFVRGVYRYVPIGVK